MKLFIAPDRECPVRPATVPELRNHRPGYQPNRGYYFLNPPEIALNPHLPPPEQAEVLIHEVIHAVWAQRRMSPRVTEESAAGHLGDGLATVLQLNPWLMAALAGALYHGVPIVTERR